MKKVMDTYCTRMGTQHGSYRFLFDGRRVQDTDTAESLELENDDSLDALVTQLGGAAPFPFSF